MIYKENYEVYEDGRIYSYKTNKFMKPFILGYKYSGVSINRKPEYAHRIIAECFVENPFNKPQVNHKDGNTHNNHPSNLEWVSVSENIKHTYDTLGRKGRKQNFWKGKTHSEETKQKMSLAKLK